MADRYWVGITGTWNTSSTTVWSAAAPLALATASCSSTTLTTTGSPALVVGMTVWSSGFVSLGTITGGSGNTWTVSVGGTYASQTMIAATTGASVPTAADNVFFTRPSANYTVTLSGVLTCNNFNKTGTTITFASTGALAVFGSFILAGTTTWTAGGTITFSSTTTGNTIDTNGATINGSFTFNGVGGQWALTSAVTMSISSLITLTNGSLDTAGFSVAAGSFNSSNSNTRSLTLGASTLSLRDAGVVWNTNTTTGLTFSAGTSDIRCTGSLSSASFVGGGLTYATVSFTSNAQVSSTISGANTFDTLSITGRTTAGINTITLSADQTISTLTLSAGTNATMRTFLRSITIGTTRTLTVGTFTAGSADIDFRDIAITGAAAPISGTRFGDCKGNSGITFGAGANKYWNLAGNQNWSATAWATSAGGAVSANNFPLAQDTVIFTSTSPATGATTTVNANWNIGTLDMSARTANTMTLATGTTTSSIYGNWINGTGTTLTGTQTITFAGRGSQTITSAGRAFTQSIVTYSPGGSVTLLDSLSNATIISSITLSAGVFDANNFNVSYGLLNLSSTIDSRTIAFGSGTWTLSGSGSGLSAVIPTNLTVTGTATVSFTSGSSKTFAGGGIQTWPTINQGGAGQLTISGSNKIANITNTYSATGATTVRFTGGTTNEFTAFNLTGAAGKVCTLTSTDTTQAILKKIGAWNVGANSTDGGNNTGLNFTGTNPDYLSISYIDGQRVSYLYQGGTNVTSLYLGSTPVTAAYIGSTRVF
jgi:hypothetical protein